MKCTNTLSLLRRRTRVTTAEAAGSTPALFAYTTHFLFAISGHGRFELLLAQILHVALVVLLSLLTHTVLMVFDGVQVSV